MAGLTRITNPLLDVVEVLLQAAAEDRELHGWAIMHEVQRSGPTVYGVIDRLEDAGWITGRWEAVNPQPGKPRRRLYRLTGEGAVRARELLEVRRPAARAKPETGPSPALGWWSSSRLAWGS